MRSSRIMRHLADGIRRSRAPLVVLAVLWLPALVSPCVAERSTCHPVAAHHGTRHDGAPAPAHGCCVVSGGPCVAEAPAPVDTTPDRVAIACPPVADTIETASPTYHRTPVTHGPPAYLRLRVLLI